MKVARCWIVAATLLLLTSPLSASVAERVADLRSDEESDAGSLPERLRVLGDRVVFTADVDGVGREFWSIDPELPHDLQLLNDTCEGDCGSVRVVGQTSSHFFWLDFADDLPRLWASDGTRRGTALLPVPAVQGPTAVGRFYAATDQRLFFVGQDPEAGAELWQSDGTVAGTGRVLDLRPGSESAAVGWLTGVGDAVRFVASASSGDRAFWRSDGTEAGTVRLSDAVAGAEQLTAVGERVYFLGDGAEGRELWVSEGTVSPPVQLTDFAIDDPFGFELPLWPIDGALYFLVFDEIEGWELWRSDGTQESTRRMTRFDHPFPFGNPPMPIPPQAMGDSLVLTVSNNGTLLVPWITDGSRQGARSLLTGCGSRCERIHSIRDLVVVGEEAFFVASTELGTELWRADGSPSGPRLVADHCPGGCGLVDGVHRTQTGLAYAALTTRGVELFELPVGGEPRQLTEFDNRTPLTTLGAEDRTLVEIGERYVFPANDGATGTELWSADSDGTRLLADLGRSVPSSSPNFLTAVGDTGAIFFVCPRVRTTTDLWSVGGPSDAPARLAGLGQSCSEFSPGQPERIGDEAIFFTYSTSPATLLWATDGTASGTRVIQDFFDRGRPTGRPALVGDRYWFFVSSRDEGLSLWNSDGTAAGTSQMLAVEEELGISWSAFMGPGCGQPAFVAMDTRIFQTVWTSDGTVAGTVSLTEPDADNPALWRNDPGFTCLGELMYFIDSKSTGGRLWRSDGTPEGTEVVAELPSPMHFREEGFMVASGGSLFFLVDGGSSGTASLWTSDGTQEGTLELVEFGEDPSRFPPRGLTPFGGGVLVSAHHPEQGRELWISDGTAAGTELVVDLIEGSRGSSPVVLGSAGGTAYFNARTFAHGRELWATDGSAAGTHLVHDIAPGPRSSSPSGFAWSGDHLFFAADDGLTGRELWTLPLTEEGCRPEARWLCLGRDGRFRVEMSWQRPGVGLEPASAVELTDDTGYFYFDNPANIETVLKVLDARVLNEHFWTFYGGLSNTGYALTLTDVETGVTRRYFNPQGEFASVGDTSAFGPAGSSLASFVSPSGGAPNSAHVVSSATSRGGTGPCEPSELRLCLSGGRFSVEASWRDFQGETGEGTAVQRTDDTGYFWFFRDTNVETMVKVLDGRPLNGAHWVFYGALSNVAYTLTVTDTETGQIRSYSNPLRHFGSVGDTQAFPE